MSARWTRAAASRPRGWWKELARFDPTVVVSSPYLRCLQTVEPLARSLGAAVDVRAELGYERPDHEARALVESLAGITAVVCGHGGLEASCSVRTRRSSVRARPSCSTTSSASSKRCARPPDHAERGGCLPDPIPAGVRRARGARLGAIGPDLRGTVASPRAPGLGDPPCPVRLVPRSGVEDHAQRGPAPSWP